MVRDRRRLVLVPATDIDAERVRSIRAYDEPMQCVVTFTRTGKLHRWYRGLVGKVAEAIDASPDALHAELKFKAGLIEQIIPVQRAGVRGGIAVRLQSTAYPLMEDLRFSHYVDIAVELLHRDYLPQIRARRWQQQVIEWAGRRPKLTGQR